LNGIQTHGLAIVLQPKIFSGFNFTAVEVVNITAMTIHGS